MLISRKAATAKSGTCLTYITHSIQALAGDKLVEKVWEQASRSALSTSTPLRSFTTLSEEQRVESSKVMNRDAVESDQ